MKYIILTIGLVLSCFLTSCSEKPSSPELKEWKKFVDKTGFTNEKPSPQEIEDFNKNYHLWVNDYPIEQEKARALKEATKLRRQTITLWNTYKDSARNIVVKKEIVYIKRMASSSVMNSPAFYEKHYSGNTITENGRGAENEDFTVFYLSDGHIIKASPKDNPEWLGTTVGEKAIKITGKKLTPTISTIAYVDPNGKFYSSGWTGRRELKTTTAFEYKDYTTYQPLYSK